MPDFTKAGADAAGEYDHYFRQIIENDPDIQAVIQRVWGNTPVSARPSDTPKHLEQANKQASQQITQILRQKGIDLPDRTFVNPRSASLEGHRGWSGLNGWQKAAIIAAAAATGVGGLAAAGALGGGAAAGAAGGSAAAGGAGAGTAGSIAGLGAGLGVTTGVPAGLGAVGATGITAGGVAAGSSPWISALTNAGVNAAKTKATGGSWKDALISGGVGAATGGIGTGAGGSMSWTDLLKDPDTYAAIAQVAGKAAGSKSDQRVQESALTNQFNNSEIARYQTEQAAQNQAGQLDLQRKMFSEDARGGRAKQALLADLISNLQDIAIDVPGVQTARVTGGLRPSAIGATGKQSMAELAKQALQAQLSGDTFTGGEILQGPSMTPMPKQGGVERALDWIGLLGAGAGALGNIQQPTTYSQLPGATGIKPRGLGY